MRCLDASRLAIYSSHSPQGFQKDDFYKYLLAESVRRDDRPFIENKSKFVLCHASSGHKHAIEELFSNPDITSKMEETKLSKEIQVLNKFMRLLDTNPDKAYYGYLHVTKANEEQAIDSLLVSDGLFRSEDIKERKKYVALVESVRDNGGRVYLFSTMHVSGQQLQQVSGVAAILRYPLPDLDELEEIAAAHEEEFEEYASDEDLSPEEKKAREEAKMLEDMQYFGFVSETSGVDKLI